MNYGGAIKVNEILSLQKSEKAIKQGKPKHRDGTNVSPHPLKTGQ